VYGDGKYVLAGASGRISTADGWAGGEGRGQRRTFSCDPKLEPGSHCRMLCLFESDSSENGP
jgi:hypothetical protein